MPLYALVLRRWDFPSVEDVLQRVTPSVRALVRMFAVMFIAPIVRVAMLFLSSPNAATVAGTLVGVLSGVFFGWGFAAIPGFLLLLSGVLDIVDGTLARKRGVSSPAGAYLDSTLDRVSESAVFIGLVFRYRDNLTWFFLVLLFWTFTYLTSYVKARAEGLGVEVGKWGLERPHRVTPMGMCSLYSPLLPGQDLGIQIAIGVLLPLSVLTVAHRMRTSYGKLQGRAHP